MLIAWTTVSRRAEAETIAQTAVAQGRASCVQIDGPIASVYCWEGHVESVEEYRLTFKLLPEQAESLEQLVHKLHPYETPEWIVVPASHVSEKYLSWARATPNSSPL
ncbi:MAG: divalent-cation tolerance protein CutA [Opitutaceae bacterium]|nr:divalent-cation tolerance protein CutA [Opitutaceae bacterium]